MTCTPGEPKLRHMYDEDDCACCIVAQVELRRVAEAAWKAGWDAGIEWRVVGGPKDKPQVRLTGDQLKHRDLARLLGRADREE